MLEFIKTAINKNKRQGIPFQNDVVEIKPIKAKSSPDNLTNIENSTKRHATKLNMTKGSNKLFNKEQVDSIRSKSDSLKRINSRDAGVGMKQNEVQENANLSIIASALKDART